MAGVTSHLNALATPSQTTGKFVQLVKFELWVATLHWILDIPDKLSAACIYTFAIVLDTVPTHELTSVGLVLSTFTT